MQNNIKFLGNGSGFGVTHTNAYFYNNNDLIFIDLSMLNRDKAITLVEDKPENIYIVITHMHDDHFSGIPLFLQYCFYTKGIKPTVVIPKELGNDILIEFKLKGVNPTICNIKVADDKSYTWLKKVIQTTHAPELKDKCFGYMFEVNKKKCLYTGDTCKLEDFIPYIKEVDEFYVDMSFAYGQVHLLWEDVKFKLQEFAKNHQIYLMHIDEMKQARETLQSFNKTFNCDIEIVKCEVNRFI